MYPRNAQHSDGDDEGSGLGEDEEAVVVGEKGRREKEERTEDSHRVSVFSDTSQREASNVFLQPPKLCSNCMKSRSKVCMHTNRLFSFKRVLLLLHKYAEMSVQNDICEF